MTALLLVPMIGTAGLAVDFANALNIRNQLYAAADAAAAGSLAEKSAGIAAATAMASDGTVTVAQTDANTLFFGQNSAALTSSNVHVSIAVTKTGNTLQRMSASPHRCRRRSCMSLARIPFPLPARRRR